VTTISDKSQAGVHTFGYIISAHEDYEWEFPNPVYNAFKVTIVDPDTICSVTTNVCAASHTYVYDHLAGVTETNIQPTFTLSVGCTGTPTYTCTTNSPE